MGMYAAGFMGFVTFFMIRSKSAKMKQLGKLSFIPSIFNITEPIMFGMPIILNPIFFIPQVCTQLIAGFVTWGLTTTILPINLNPTMSLLPWTTPTFIKNAILRWRQLHDLDGDLYVDWYHYVVSFS